MKLIEKALKEGKSGIEFQVVYVNSIDSAVVRLNDKNYSDVSKVAKEAYEQLLKQDPNASDDFWIDDIDVTKGGLDYKLDWRTILTDGGSSLDQDMVDLIFEDSDVAVKIEYLIKNRGERAKDINESMLEDVMVYDARNDSDVYSNDNSKYPEGWVDDQIELYYSDIEKVLDKYHANGYFDYASLISDAEINGDFDSAWIGDYFVTYNR